MPHLLRIGSFASVVILFLAPGCSRPDPCVVCPDVAGVYAVHADETDPSASTCGELYFQGMTTSLTFAQDGSDLTLVDLDVEGTLYEDLSAHFTPYEGYVSGTGEPGTQTWTASFSEGEDGRWSVVGYITFARNHDGCYVNVQYRGEQVD